MYANIIRIIWLWRFLGMPKIGEFEHEISMYFQHKQKYKTVYLMQIFIHIHLHILQKAWKVVLVFVRIDVSLIRNTQIQKRNCVKYVFVLVCRQFLPILLLLFKRSRKCEGVPKFVLEKLSYILVFDFKYFKLDSKSIKSV